MRYRVAVVLLAQIGSLCNNDDAKDDAWLVKKNNLYFASEIRDSIDLTSTPVALKTCVG